MNLSKTRANRAVGVFTLDVRENHWRTEGSSETLGGAGEPPDGNEMFTLTRWTWPPRDKMATKPTGSVWMDMVRPSGPCPHAAMA